MSKDTLVKNNIDINPEQVDNMSESCNKESGGDIAIVQKEETPSQAEIKALNERIMKKSSLKL